MEEKKDGYAWKWFKYHANQRMMAFYYYLLIIGALSYGYIAISCSKYPNNTIANAICVIVMFVTIAFLIIERRNLELVEDGREAMRKLGINGEGLKILNLDEKRSNWHLIGKMLTHTFALRIIFITIFVASMCALFNVYDIGALKNMSVFLSVLFLILCLSITRKREMM